MRDDAFAAARRHRPRRRRRRRATRPRSRSTTVTDARPTRTGHRCARVEGTITVPNYLTPQVERGVAADRRTAARHDAGRRPPAPSTVARSRRPARGSRRRRPARREPGAADRRRAVRVQPARAAPTPTPAPRRRCSTATACSAAGARRTAAAPRTSACAGFAPCAVDWWGMSTADLANVAPILTDMSNFPSLADRAQQGFLNFLYLGRALAHPDGLRRRPGVPGRRRHAAPRAPASSSTTATARAGSWAARSTALAPDFTRAKLGVPGDELLDAAEPQRRLGGRVRARSPTPPTRARSTSSCCSR